jgi:superfamily I DNA/RNA helicase
VALSSDFNHFGEIENRKPVIDMGEAYIMYVALTRARDKLILSPACVKAIRLRKTGGRAGKPPHLSASMTATLRRSIEKL